MKQSSSLKHQQGYLTLITVVLIVIVGFIAVALAYITFGSAFGALSLQDSTAALYLAESGLENATHALLATTLTNRSACAGLSLTNSSIGSGAYAVTSTGPFYTSSTTTLNGALTANATSIPVVSTSNYQSTGRIMIDQELINYAAVDATDFLFVQRGVDGSLAASHTTGTRIGQYQCNLSSQGGVPSLSPPSISFGGKRLLTESIQLQDGWAVGSTLAGPTAWNLAHWNTPTEKQWTQQSPAIATPQILNAVSIVSNVDVWAVGNKAAALHFNGSTWANVTGVTASDNLLSVSGVSSGEAWTCSDAGKIYKWTGGASWSNTFTSAGVSLNDMSMLDINGNSTADVGWVVGTKKTAILYNGTTWTSTNTGITVDLNGVSTLSATDAWAAGLTGKIYQWTGGASWAVVSTPASVTLNSISMIKSGASDVGWAVGNSSTAWFYNGTSWASSNTGLAGALTLNTVVTVSLNEAWLVDSSGDIYEWNGSTWTLIFTSSKALNGIDVLHPNSQPFSAWAENFS